MKLRTACTITMISADVIKKNETLKYIRVRGGGSIKFWTLEGDPGRHPRVVIKTSDGRRGRLPLAIGKQEGHDAPRQSHGERVDQHRCRMTFPVIP